MKKFTRKIFFRGFALWNDHFHILKDVIAFIRLIQVKQVDNDIVYYVLQSKVSYQAVAYPILYRSGNWVVAEAWYEPIMSLISEDFVYSYAIYLSQNYCI